MKEILKILEIYSSLDFSRRKAAMATVVKVEGSSYRRPGARMLITDDGRWEGAISGGCLEGDALRKARKVIHEGIPRVVVYDTTEGSGSLGVGLGCNGIIEVLIEPIDPSSANNPVQSLNTIASAKSNYVIATLFNTTEDLSMLESKRIALKDGALSETLPDGGCNTSLRDLMNEALSQRKSITKRIDCPAGSFDVFAEIIKPGIQVVIIGAGYDAISMAAMCKELGWSVTVTDECIAHLLPARFPTANQLILSNREAFPGEFELMERSAVILMTHNYHYDKRVLEKLFDAPAQYIGVLGPRKRFEKMLLEWKNERKNHLLVLEEKIFSPIGLDIGAETPDEIALSVTAEIQAFFCGKSLRSLKYKRGPIHEN